MTENISQTNLTSTIVNSRAISGFSNQSDYDSSSLPIYDRNSNSFIERSSSTLSNQGLKYKRDIDLNKSKTRQLSMRPISIYPLKSRGTSPLLQRESSSYYTPRNIDNKSSISKIANNGSSQKNLTELRKSSKKINRNDSIHRIQSSYDLNRSYRSKLNTKEQFFNHDSRSFTPTRVQNRNWSAPLILKNDNQSYNFITPRNTSPMSYNSSEQSIYSKYRSPMPRLRSSQQMSNINRSYYSEENSVCGPYNTRTYTPSQEYRRNCISSSTYPTFQSMPLNTNSRLYIGSRSQYWNKIDYPITTTSSFKPLRNGQRITATFYRGQHNKSYNRYT